MVGVGGLAVSLFNEDDTGAVAWEWELLDSPLNSALVPGSLGTSATASFTPDTPETPGCYRVKLTVQGADGSVACDVKNFAVPTAQGWILPPFKATAAELNFPGNEEGWESLLNEIFLDLASGSGSDVAVKVTASDTTSAVLDSKVSPGAGLTRTVLNPGASEQYELDVAANVDGSIVVNADDVQVGVLATDVQHGSRGGGTQHAVATPSVAGFLSASDKTLIDTLAAGGSSQLLWGDDLIGTSTTVRYLTPGYDDGQAGTAPTAVRLARAGTLRSMRIEHNVPGVGGNVTYTLVINGTPTALTVTLAASGTNASDLANSVVIAAGDVAEVQVTKAGAITASPNNVTCTLEYV
jgi:hypothetical protein